MNPEEWVIENLITDRHDWRTSNKPFFWYPWNGEFDAAALRKSLLEGGRKFNIRKSKTKFEKDVRLFTPDAIIHAGDKIVIREIKEIVTEISLKHKHDEIERHAYLDILRKSGQITKVRRPLVFYGIMSLKRNRAASHVSLFDKIGMRILDHFDIRNFFDDKTMPIIQRNKEYLPSDERAYRAYWDLLVNHKEALAARNPFTNEAQDESLLSTFKAIEYAITAGYYWACAEAEGNIKPLAFSALKVKAGGTTGGSNSGKVRRQNRIDTWEPIARQMAKDIRAAKPTASQDEVAADIAYGWKREDYSAPGHTTLKQLVSLMERAGELPPRQRKQSAKGLRLAK